MFTLLCYPEDHFGLPEQTDVRDGLAAYRIANHSADVANSREGARAWDDARYAFDWCEQFGLAVDPERATSYDDQTLRRDDD